MLLLGFNRPDHVAKLVEAIRPIAPTRVYCGCDGPREGIGSDRQSCSEVRRIMGSIPWTGVLRTRFLDRNVGCAEAVSGAIDWFFEFEEFGVVLEDDCIPAPDFIPFCAEVLHRYRDEPRVMSVLGTRCAGPALPTGPSYGFSRYFNVWGWGSWRRAWRLRQHDLRGWRSRRQGGNPLEALPRVSRKGWAKKFDRLCRQARPSTWDHQWTFAHFLHDGLCVLPGVNLIKNIGAGADATHCKKASPWIDRSTGSLTWPLTHPGVLLPDERSDLHYERYRNNHRAFALRKLAQWGESLQVGSERWRRGGID